MVFARNLKYRREGVLEAVHGFPYLLSDLWFLVSICLAALPGTVHVG